MIESKRYCDLCGEETVQNELYVETNSEGYYKIPLDSIRLVLCDGPEEGTPSRFCNAKIDICRSCFSKWRERGFEGEPK